MIFDGGMGTMIQKRKFEEEDFRGNLLFTQTCLTFCLISSKKLQKFLSLKDLISIDKRYCMCSVKFQDELSI